MKNSRTYRLLVLVFGMVLALSASAAPATANYFCDFEDDAEASEWVSWGGATATRQKHSTWKSGGAAYYTGQKGLYISDLDIDSVGGNTHSYPKASGYTVSAYRKLTLEPGSYTVSLDYLCPSELLSVSLVQADTLEASSIQTQTGADYAAVVKNGILPALKDLKSSVWMHASGQQQVLAAGTYLLVVTYRTSAGPDLAFGAAVDNLELIKNQTDDSACDYPITDLRLDLISGFVQLTWKGNADSYEIRYFDSDGQLVIIDNQPDTGLTDSCLIPLENMEDGTYSFMVRGLGCGNNNARSGWSYVWHKLIYDPEAHCIDFLNFDARGVSCKYGEGNWGGLIAREVITSSVTGYVDYGSESQYNTHTIHFKPNERDYMTNNLLRTVPEGSFASVRLGSREPANLAPGSHWQSVSYTIHVTEGMGVVLFRYAYIGQTGGHSGLEQSHIRLRLTDQNGNVINGEDCGSILFVSPTNDAEMNLLNMNPKTAGWHKGRQDSGEGTICNDYVYWRDWTTVGVNVQDYLDQDIKIEVTNYGCGDYCHYGYCYFVLDCSEGELQGASCGEKPRSLRVDEGFDYRWYKPFNPDEPFYEGQNPNLDSLYISPQDTNTYYVDLMRKGNNDCYFTLHASALKRLPVAEMQMTHTPVNCVNYVTITDLSGVDHFYPSASGDSAVRFTDELTRELFTWSTSSGRADTCSAATLAPIEVSPDGDTLTVKLEVFMKEGCSADTLLRFVVPAIGPNIGRDTVYLVYGDSVEFQGEWYAEEGDYEVRLTNWMGCDSILSLHVDYLLAADSVTVDTICQGETYHYVTYEGRSFDYSESGIYTDICKSKVLDSDSIVYTLKLTVLDSLAVNLSTTSCVLCADTAAVSFDYAVAQGVTDRCSLVFLEDNPTQLADVSLSDLDENGTITVPIAPTDGTYRTPGLYKAMLTFFDKNGCADQSYLLTFDVLFPAGIIFQRWDDVLAVKNAENNGGYTFAAYQWIKDGADIEDQTASYYYEPEKLSLTSAYQVRLSDAAGQSWLSCPFVPAPYAGGINVSPRYISRSQQLTVTSPEAASVRFYNLSGMMLFSRQVEAGDTVMDVPVESGICIVQVLTDSDTRSFRLNISE